MGFSYRQDADAAAGVVRDIELAGGRALAVQADVGVESDVERLFDAVQGKFGPLSGLVNNAGTLERQGRVDELDAARLTRIMTTNVIGPFLCAGAAVRAMSTRYGGAGASS